jgi:uncharacterized protein (DUF433 family)
MASAPAPTGRYLAHEAGRLVGVPGDRIGQWARWGHIRASISDGDPHVYSFADVAEALAVHLLLQVGFTLPLVRRAVDALGGAAAHPLSGGALHVVDGRLAVERGDVLEDVFTLHGVLPLDGRLDATALLRRGGWPVRDAEDLAVEVDPARAGGRPCVRGRRIPVEDVAAEPDSAALELGLSDEQVADAVRWWATAEAGVRA